MHHNGNICDLYAACNTRTCPYTYSTRWAPSQTAPTGRRRHYPRKDLIAPNPNKSSTQKLSAHPRSRTPNSARSGRLTDRTRVYSARLERRVGKGAAVTSDNNGMVHPHTATATDSAITKALPPFSTKSSRPKSSASHYSGQGSRGSGSGGAVGNGQGIRPTLVDRFYSDYGYQGITSPRDVLKLHVNAKRWLIDIDLVPFIPFQEIKVKNRASWTLAPLYELWRLLVIFLLPSSTCCEGHYFTYSAPAQKSSVLTSAEAYLVPVCRLEVLRLA